LSKEVTKMMGKMKKSKTGNAQAEALI
jgi:hypothetical protein